MCEHKRLVKTFGQFNDGSGFLGRWLYIMPSSDRVPEELNFNKVPEEIKERWKNKLLSLMAMKPRKYKLTEEAQTVFSEYYTQNQRIINAIKKYEIELEAEIRPKIYGDTLH